MKTDGETLEQRVDYLQLGERKLETVEGLAGRMWRLHRELAAGGGWTELLTAMKEEAQRGEGIRKLSRVATIIWEGEEEFFDTVCECPQEKTDASSGRALGCFLAMEGEVRKALVRGEGVLRSNPTGAMECFLPIRREGQFLGVFYLDIYEGEGVREWLREVHQLFEIPGVELIERHRKERSLRTYQEETRYFRDRERQQYLFKDLVCESEAMQQVYDELNERVDDEDPIWMTGEAGTGKELLARAIHHLGGRQEGMLIRMACAKFPEELVDIELFGCVPSELTGAVAPRKGIFELAEEGTIYLDEIDQLNLTIQGKLVRLMKEKEVRRIGDVVGRPVNVRIIASSHRDLERLCKKGRFRLELFELLAPHRLEVPALRQRREDILPLAKMFLEKFADRYEARCGEISEELGDWLQSYQWPGNVRQLQTFMEAAVLMAQEKEVIEREDLALV